MKNEIKDKEFEKAYEYLAYDSGDNTEKSPIPWAHMCLENENDIIRYKQIVVEIAKMREEMRSFKVKDIAKEYKSKRVVICSFEIAFSQLCGHPDYIKKL